MLRLGVARMRRAGDQSLTEGAVGRLEARLSNSIAAKARRRQNIPAFNFPDSLPITAKKDEIVEAIRRHPVVIISGETGCGKSTQIPKMCLEAGRGSTGMIGRTQPRRIAAVTIAGASPRRWASRLGPAGRLQDPLRGPTSPDACDQGHDRRHPARRDAGRPRLSGLRHHHHRRGPRAEPQHRLPPGHRRGPCSPARRDLRLIITSATLDTEKFPRPPSATRRSSRSAAGPIPVEVEYRPPDRGAGSERRSTPTPSSRPSSAVAGSSRNDGRATSSSSCRPSRISSRPAKCWRAQARPACRSCRSSPACPRPSRGASFTPCRGRKIVVATNVAETSLTIPGIRYVVDTGLARISQYLPGHAHQQPADPARSRKQQRRPAQGPLRPRRGRRLHPPLRRGRLPRARPPFTAARDPALQPGRGHPAHDRPRPRPSVAKFPFIDRPGAQHRRRLRAALRAGGDRGRGEGEGGRPRSEDGRRRRAGRTCG